MEKRERVEEEREKRGEFVEELGRGRREREQLERR